MEQFENDGRACETEAKKEKKSHAGGLMKNIIFTLIVAVMGIAAFSGTTYAWYIDSVRANVYQLEAANCQTSVLVSEVTAADANSAQSRAVEYLSPKTASGELSYDLEKDKTYSIYISSSGTASTSYCVIKIGTTEYVTAQVKVNNTAANQGGIPIEFNLKPTENITITVCPRFGLSAVLESERDFVDGGDYTYSGTTLSDGITAKVSDEKTESDAQSETKDENADSDAQSSSGDETPATPSNENEGTPETPSGEDGETPENGDAES